MHSNPAQSEQFLYLKVRDRLFERIGEVGFISPSGRLPSERELSQQFDTTRITLRQALCQLENEGIIYRSNRIGWFVCPSRLNYNPVLDYSFTHNALSQGRQPKTEVLGIDSLMADKRIAHQLAIGIGDPVYCLRRRRYIDNRLVLVETIWLNKQLLPDFEHQSLNSVWQTLHENYGILLSDKKISIVATSLTKGIASALAVNEGCPGLYICRTSKAPNGSVITFDEEYWLHNVLTIEVCSQKD